MPTNEGDQPTGKLAQVLFPRARTAVLSELSSLGESGLHLREIARRTGLNSKTVMRELHALRDAGILASERVGNQVIYRFNTHCPIYEELRSIVRKTVGLAGVLRDALAPFESRIEEAFVYGSHARGEEEEESDVDLMIVGDVSLREISSAVRDAGRALRRVVNPTLYSPADYAKECATANSFVERVATGLRIDVLGRRQP